MAIKCGDCGRHLPSEMLATELVRNPCPVCGSTKQHIALNFFEEATLKLRDWMKGKIKDVTRRSKEKVRREFFYGSDQRKSCGEYIYKEREIDRDDNRYRELIRSESGEIIRDVDQPLSDHINHGSAKSKQRKLKGNGQSS